MTREELANSERGERAYYYSKTDLKNRIRLPLTLDGCEAILEIVTKAMDLPFDETTRQVFAGYVHHMSQTENSTTLDEIGKLLFNHAAKDVTWRLDQASKERVAVAKAAAKAAEEKAKGASEAETPAITTAPDVAPQPLQS